MKAMHLWAGVIALAAVIRHLGVRMRSRINLSADTLATVRRVDGAITTVFWYPPRPSNSEQDTIVGRRPSGTPRPAMARLARVLEIHYLRN